MLRRTGNRGDTGRGIALTADATLEAVATTISDSALGISIIQSAATTTSGVIAKASIAGVYIDQLKSSPTCFTHRNDGNVAVSTGTYLPVPQPAGAPPPVCPHVEAVSVPSW